MITNEQKKIIIDNIVHLLELPDSAYDKARKRYEDLGEWFDRNESEVVGNNPHIFPQGSFRLGTAIRPIDESEEYDLDLACKLRDGINKDRYTQEDLKNLVGVELEAYRKARGIKNEKEPKHRCWRLKYQDDLSFHMDIVPCIPSDEYKQNVIMESMRESGLEDPVASQLVQTTVFISDDRLENFRQISPDWKISNPEGYAKWFEYRMNPRRFLTQLEKAQIDEVPLFRRKTPLQRAIQILKRHRDNWSRENPDSKPISIILTTLAARAYNQEVDVVTALENIVEKMGDWINPGIPRIPNPVDPNEDFADRWYRSDCYHLRLEDNFNKWLFQAQKDFKHITSTTDTEFIFELMESKFSLKANPIELRDRLGSSSYTANIIIPKTHTIDPQSPPKPWKL